MVLVNLPMVGDVKETRAKGRQRKPAEYMIQSRSSGNVRQDRWSESKSARQRWFCSLVNRSSCWFLGGFDNSLEKKKIESLLGSSFMHGPPSEVI